MKKPELLAPVGNWTMLVSAIDAGCDAIYFGLKTLNMRANANNFELSEIKKVADYCHDKKKNKKKKIKSYLTVNTIVYDDELKKIKKILKAAKQAKIDAIIAWDFSVIEEAKKQKIPVHISTQASISNSQSLEFFKNLGAERAVLARECSLKQIKDIKKKSKGIEIEVFCHGAMCVSVSGRCLTSQFLFNKSANRGDCLQPCRRTFTVKDKEEGYELELDHNTIMSAKDLCTLPFLDQLIKAGVDSLKIEGRNRNPEYVYTIVSAYRKAIDALSKKKFNKKTAEKLVEELRKVYNRKFSSGFYLGLPTKFDYTDIYGSDATRRKVFIGVVKNYLNKVGVAEVKLTAGGIAVGDEIFIQGKRTGHLSLKVKSLEINHKKIKSAEKGKKVGMKIEEEVRPKDKVFIVKNF